MDAVLRAIVAEIDDHSLLGVPKVKVLRATKRRPTSMARTEERPEPSAAAGAGAESGAKRAARRRQKRDRRAARRRTSGVPAPTGLASGESPPPPGAGGVTSLPGVGDASAETAAVAVEAKRILHQHATTAAKAWRAVPWATAARRYGRLQFAITRALWRRIRRCLLRATRIGGLAPAKRKPRVYPGISLHNLACRLTRNFRMDPLL